jgi:FxsC-like protein
MPASAAVTEPYFFLSYTHKSHGDARAEGEPDYWVGELFRDLCRAIERQVALPKSVSAGFMDTDRRVGSDWPAGLVRALDTCRVFVPLYSSRYFTDENCGQEWNYFTHRTLDHVRPEPAIVPVIWDPVQPRRLPEAARAPQFRYRGGDAYEDFGLFGLMKVSRYRKQYDEAISGLVGMMVTAAERRSVARGSTVDPRSLESAFGSAEARRGGSGAMRVRITVAALRRDQLPAVRRNVAFYGPSALDWDPYATEPPRPVAREAAAVVRSLGYEVEVGHLYEHADDLMSGDPQHGPQILIVDPWALAVPRTQELLQVLTSRRMPWVMVLIPWNEADNESRESEATLRAVLNAAFEAKLTETASTSVLAVEGVPNIDDFGNVLGQLIGAATRKYLRNAAAYPPPGESIERPRLVVRPSPGL